MAGQRDEPRWPISDVLDRTDLSMLLDELAQPAARYGPGRRWHCPMPAHDDHRASVTMFRDHRGHERWRCWSADHRGDAIDLVVAVQGRSRDDAVDWLAGRAGMAPGRPLPAVQPKRSPARTETAKVMDDVVADYVRDCAALLRGPQGRHVRSWLHNRGLNDDTIAANWIGVDPGRRSLRRAQGLPYGAGVAATFPVFDPVGNLTYVQARYLHPDRTGRKYDNPAAALAPHPRLGFTVPVGDLRDEPFLLVCEGMPDALTAAQGGYQAAALLGAHTPDDTVAARLANHATNLACHLALICDPDPAGRRVAETLSPLLQQRGHNPSVVTPPNGQDLNAWATTDPTWADQLTRTLSTAAVVDLDVSAGVDVDL